MAYVVMAYTVMADCITAVHCLRGCPERYSDAGDVVVRQVPLRLERRKEVFSYF